MKTKNWVGISLLIAVILTVGIIGFGLLPDYLTANKNPVIASIDKSGTPSVLAPQPVVNTSPPPAPQQNTTEQAQTPPAGQVTPTPVVTPPPAPAPMAPYRPRVTRAS